MPDLEPGNNIHEVMLGDPAESVGFERAEQFNAASALLQAEAGVDPEECMRIQMMLATEPEERTKLPILFTGMMHGDWVTPLDAKYLGHDIKTHWQAVRCLHPDFLKVVMQAAEVGYEYHQAGDKVRAEFMGNKIDFFIDNGLFIGMKQGQDNFLWLADAVGIPEGALPDYAIQREHTLKMLSVITKERRRQKELADQQKTGQVEQLLLI